MLPGHWRYMTTCVPKPAARKAVLRSDELPDVRGEDKRRRGVGRGADRSGPALPDRGGDHLEHGAGLQAAGAFPELGLDAVDVAPGDGAVGVGEVDVLEGGRRSRRGG